MQPVPAMQELHVPIHGHRMAITNEAVVLNLGLYGFSLGLLREILNYYSGGVNSSRMN